MAAKKNIDETLHTELKAYIELQDYTKLRSLIKHNLEVKNSLKEKLHFLLIIFNFLIETKDFEIARFLSEIILPEIKSSNTSDLCILYYFSGTGHSLSRQWPQAERAYQEALEIVESYSFKATLLNNLGEVFLQQGYFEKSINLFRESITINKSLLKTNADKNIDLSFNHFNLGLVFYQIENNQSAFNHFTHALQYYPKSDSDGDYFSSLLFALIIISVDQNDLETAREYLTQFEETYDVISHESGSIRLQLSRALIFSKGRMKEKGLAIEILESIEKKYQTNLEVNLFVQKNILELLFLEAKIDLDNEILQDIYKIIRKLQIQAFKMNSKGLYVDVLLLRCRYLALKGDLNQFNIYFDQASKIVEDFDLFYKKNHLEAVTSLLKMNNQLEPQYELKPIKRELDYIMNSLQNLVENIKEESKEDLKSTVHSSINELSKNVQLNQILQIVKNNPDGIPQKDLPTILKTSKSTISRRLSELEKKKLIERKLHGRAITVYAIN